MEEELIRVVEKDGKQAVSARELYEFLGATERFSNWFERQLQFGFDEKVDYVGCKVFNTLANQELTDYAMTIDMAKEISMLQRSDKGKEARLYFIACEKKLISLSLPSYQIEDKIERAKKWIKEQEQLRQAQLEANNAKEHVNMLIHNGKPYTSSEIAKECNLKSAQVLNTLLSEKGIQFKQNGTWLLYSKYADKGLVSIKQTILDNGRIIYDRQWTGKGRDFILNLLK